MLNLHGKQATGRGTFVHKDADGNTVAEGTWAAIELISSKSYGPNLADFPAEFEAGKAKTLVELSVGGEPVATGLLQVGCLLGGPQEPGGAYEGARLNIKGGLNFNKDDEGITLFIKL